MAETIRTFIAFGLPGDVLAHIGEVQKRLKKELFPMRWVKPGNIHLTLKFLGDTEESKLEVIGEAITEAAESVRSFSLSAGGIGVFPNIKRARVMWIGLKGDTQALFQVKDKLEDSLEERGFPREKRPFKAHLTLGRAKGTLDPKRILSAINSMGGNESGIFVPDTLTLYKSDLKPTGAVYTKLFGARLKEGPKG